MSGLPPSLANWVWAVCFSEATVACEVSNAARVEGIVFEGMAVSDGNGAGIRLETGDLAIDNSVFRDSQQGLLTATYPQGSITVTRFDT